LPADTRASGVTITGEVLATAPLHVYCDGKKCPGAGSAEAF
jgi:hypothetical protein